LLLITQYMEIGTGYFSVIIAAPSVVVASVAFFMFGIVGILRGDPAFAPKYAQRLVGFFYRVRMHQ